jgi:glycosyltransferase involved in cell wall biosynthesis
VKLSIVIPAYNEEHYLPATLEALNVALKAIDDSEVTVVDNMSTDRTKEIAIELGARVIEEDIRNIGQVRNSGADNSTGDVIIFLDADTLVGPGVFEKISDSMSDPRCVGGSVAVTFENPQRSWLRSFTKLWDFWGRLLKMRGGALQFARRDVFTELDGYDSTIYVGEDIEFHWRLDRLAKKRDGFTAFIETPVAITSSRRWDKMGL